MTSFIGRTGERAALAAVLAEHRMVTATGPGGIGKTRLALSVAAELAPACRDGAWFVDLVHVTDPAMVAAVVAETVGVPEQRTTSVERALVAALADRDALLVLDNCEHVLDGVRACVERIVAGAPEITVLATSRIRLLLPYESVYVVPGMSVVDGGGDAVDLFTARVATATGEVDLPDVGRVAALCQALDGIALAIELAAARYATLGLDGLESGLDQRLRFLTAGARVADRHGSLREAIGWSYNLLLPDDRALLRRIAVFASWFDIDAARAVAGAGHDRSELIDGLARLAEHSLLLVERGEPTRYRALETIRQHGVELLDQAGELGQTRASHERWCRLALAALRRSRGFEIDDAWCDRFDRVVDDADAALAWTAGEDSWREQAVELAAGLADLLFLRGRQAQAQRRYEQAGELALSPADRIRFVRLAAGEYADRLACLPFRDEHLGIVRRMIVDALAGRFDDVVHDAERFRIGWERGGRQAAPGLAKGAYSAAMVHGMLGNDEQRALWRQITLDLGVTAEHLDDLVTGWAPTFDALLALHRGTPGGALSRLSADLDDSRISTCPGIDWRPWYAAAWAEAAVHAHHDDALSRIDRARRAASDNPIASTIIERAAAIAADDRSAVENVAATFARLGCPYQEARTRTLVRTYRW